MTIICALGWWFNFIGFRIQIFSIIFSAVYLILNAILLGRILVKIINLDRELEFIFGVCVLIFLIGFGLAFPIFFYKLLPIHLLIVLLILTILISLSVKYCPLPEGMSLRRLEDNKGIRMPKSFFILFVVLLAVGLFFLLRSRTGEFITSPWQVIRPYYLYVWGLLVAIVGFAVFSKIKIRKFFLLIILASLLLHAYLPIVYKAGFGGDKWRHLGAEQSLMAGEPYYPVLFGDRVDMKKIGPVSVPEVLIVGNKNSYVNMWGATIALSWMSGMDIFWIDLVLGFLLYSIFLPLLLFRFGEFILSKKRFLLLLAFLPLCFSPFQMYGAITTSNAFGFLWFLFTLLILCQAIKFKLNKYLWWAVIIAILLNYLNYILYLILILEIIIVSFCLKKIVNRVDSHSKYFWIVSLIILILLFCILLPIVDLAGGNVFKSWDWIKNNFLKDIFDFIKTLVLSNPIFPRMFNMEQDNWLFAQANQNISRANLLKLIRWSFVLAPLVFMVMIWGMVRRDKNNIIKKLLMILLLIVIVNQFLATYFMDGNHIFNKRLVIFTSFLAMVMLALGIEAWLSIKRFSQIVKIITAVLFLALLSTTVYASGPKMQTVTSDELTAAKYLWQKISATGQKKYCVLANTWPLLALEGVSGRQIVTGGFPVYFEYAQPERVQLFDNLNKNPSLIDINRALAITGADDCYVMTEDRWIYLYNRQEILTRLNDILGQPEMIGDVYLWHWQPKK
ncbi:MAG: hypothetical protein PHN36_02985 [Patescibacteria group bacterium]|nr:hypothetical protein [Patescibacteria group bacterium]